MFRRDSRLFIKSLRVAVLIGAVFLAGCIGTVLLISKSEAGGSKPLTLALVNEDTGSSFADMVLAVIAENDNIAAAVDVKFCGSEEEAVRAVTGGAAAALIIPQDFFASVNYGENYPCKILLNRANTAAARAVSYFADLGSDMLSAAQYAIYEGDVYLIGAGAQDSVRSDYNYALNTAMVAEAASAPERYFVPVRLSYTANGLPRTAHYAALFTGFFFGLLCICFYRLYREDCGREKLTRLFAAGVSRFGFLFWKVFLPFLLFAALLAVLLFAGGGFVEISWSIPGIILALLSALFAALIGASCGIWFGDASGAVLFAVWFVSLFFCGGILPYSSLSPAVLRIGEFTPLGVIYAALSPLFGGRADPRVLIAAAVYVTLCVLAVRISLKRLLIGKEIV